MNTFYCYDKRLFDPQVPYDNMLGTAEVCTKLDFDMEEKIPLLYDACFHLRLFMMDVETRRMEIVIFIPLLLKTRLLVEAFTAGLSSEVLEIPEEQRLFKIDGHTIYFSSAPIVYVGCRL